MPSQAASAACRVAYRVAFKGKLRFSKGSQPGRPAGLPSQAASAACRVAYRVALRLVRLVGLPIGFASTVGSL